eukprot:gene31794-6991_t
MLSGVMVSDCDTGNALPVLRGRLKPIGIATYSRDDELAKDTSQPLVVRVDEPQVLEVPASKWRARRYGAKLGPPPSFMLEYEDEAMKRRVRVVRMTGIKPDMDLNRLANKVIRCFPKNLDIRSVKVDQVKRMLTKLFNLSSHSTGCSQTCSSPLASPALLGLTPPSSAPQDPQQTAFPEVLGPAPARALPRLHLPSSSKSGKKVAESPFKAAGVVIHDGMDDLDSALMDLEREMGGTPQASAQGSPNILHHSTITTTTFAGGTPQASALGSPMFSYTDCSETGSTLWGRESGAGCDTPVSTKIGSFKSTWGRRDRASDPSTTEAAGTVNNLSRSTSNSSGESSRSGRHSGSGGEGEGWGSDEGHGGRQAAMASRQSKNEEEEGALVLELELDLSIDLNKATETVLNMAKQQMDTTFNKNRLHPGDAGFQYDKPVLFEPPVEKNEWDTDEEGEPAGGEDSAQGDSGSLVGHPTDPGDEGKVQGEDITQGEDLSQLECPTDLGDEGKVQGEKLAPMGHTAELPCTGGLGGLALKEDPGPREYEGVDEEEEEDEMFSTHGTAVFSITVPLGERADEEEEEDEMFSTHGTAVSTITVSLEGYDGRSMGALLLENDEEGEGEGGRNETDCGVAVGVPQEPCCGSTGGDKSNCDSGMDSHGSLETLQAAYSESDVEDGLESGSGMDSHGSLEALQAAYSESDDEDGLQYGSGIGSHGAQEALQGPCSESAGHNMSDPVSGAPSESGGEDGLESETDMPADGHVAVEDPQASYSEPGGEDGLESDSGMPADGHVAVEYPQASYSEPGGEDGLESDSGMPADGHVAVEYPQASYSEPGGEDGLESDSGMDTDGHVAVEDPQVSYSESCDVDTRVSDSGAPRALGAPQSQCSGPGGEDGLESDSGACIALGAPQATSSEPGGEDGLESDSGMDSDGYIALEATPQAAYSESDDEDGLESGSGACIALGAPQSTCSEPGGEDGLESDSGMDADGRRALEASQASCSESDNEDLGDSDGLDSGSGADGMDSGSGADGNIEAPQASYGEPDDEDSLESGFGADGVLEAPQASYSEPDDEDGLESGFGADGVLKAPQASYNEPDDVHGSGSGFGADGVLEAPQASFNESILDSSTGDGSLFGSGSGFGGSSDMADLGL